MSLPEGISPQELHTKGMSPFSLHPMACCGMRELFSTYWTIRYSRERLLEWFEWKFIGDGDKEWNMHQEVVRGGILLLSLYTHASERIKWAEEVGFKRILDFHNHIHNSDLVLLSFQLPKNLGEWKWISKEKERKEVAV